MTNELLRDQFVLDLEEHILSEEPTRKAADTVCVVRYLRVTRANPDAPVVSLKTLKLPDFVDLMGLPRLPENILSIQRFTHGKSTPPTMYINTRKLDQRGFPIYSTRLMVHMTAISVGDVEVEMRSVTSINARFQEVTDAIILQIELVAKHKVSFAQFKYLIDEQDRVVFVGVKELVTKQAEVVVPFHVRQAAKRKQLADEQGRRLQENPAEDGPVLLPLQRVADGNVIARLTTKDKAFSRTSHRQCQGDYCDLDLRRATVNVETGVVVRRRVAALEPETSYCLIPRKFIILERQDVAMQKARRIRRRLADAHERANLGAAQEAIVEASIRDLEEMGTVNVGSLRPELFYEAVKVCETCFILYRKLDEVSLLFIEYLYS